MNAGDTELTENVTISKQFKERVVQPILKVKIRVVPVCIDVHWLQNNQSISQAIH